MITSLWTSESGLMSMQTGLDVLGYNIANVNTDAFKKNDVTFSEMLQQDYNISRININPMQKGLGAQKEDIRMIMKQGTLKSAADVTDLGINGDGFFILTDTNGDTVYSRLGRFRFDSGVQSTSSGNPVVDENGNIKYYLGNPSLTDPINLVNPDDGAKVQGWMADSQTGIINTANSVSSISLTDPYFNLAAQASTKATVTGAIDSDNLLTVFNTNSVSSVELNNIAVSEEEISDKVSIRGAAQNNTKGNYEIAIGTDGSAVVTFYPEDTLIAPTSKVFDAGSVNTSLGSNNAITNTSLIPGMELSILNDITEPLKLNITNTGESIGTQFSSVNTVYDSSGNEHSLLTTFSRIDTNTWKWRSDLVNVERYKGTGNASNFALDFDIDRNQTVTVSVSGGNNPRNLSASEFTVFEDNKILTNSVFAEPETITVSYTDVNGNARSQAFAHPEQRQVIVLDKYVDPDSIEIFVDGKETPISKDNYQVVGNKIMPVDLNGDGYSDEPFIYPGADLVVRYKLSSTQKSIDDSMLDEFRGTGYSETFELTETPGTVSAVKIVDLETGTETALSSSEYYINGKELSLTGTNNTIGQYQKLVVDYDTNIVAVNTAQTFNLTNNLSDGTDNPAYPAGPIKLNGIPAPQSLVITVNGTAVPSTAYEISGDTIVPLDTNNDGVLNAFGSPGDTVSITYDFIRETEGIITFDEDGLVTGGNRYAQITYNIKTAAEPLVLTMNFDDIIQNSGTPNSLNAYSDGYAEGLLEKIDVLQDGTVAGYYSNSVTKNIAKVALATFTNPSDLLRAGDSYFKESANSGNAVIATDIGLGTVAGSVESYRLEASNVDLGQELASMIVFQRAFQLDSKGIKTSDEMIQEAMNMKR